LNLDPRTPVIVGAGQSSERLGESGYQGRSPVDLAADAARAALAGTGADLAAVAAAIDTVAGVRQFENSVPGARAPLGRSDNYPRSVAGRLGASPARAVLEVSGGQAPQHLVNEFAAAIAAGRGDVVLLFGSEAISTIEHYAKAGQAERPDFTEHALEVVGITVGDLAWIDLYSCFPAPVFNICDGLGIAPDDPRGLTLTGGLPFFGGAGNNYSMHAIAETVRRVRSQPGTFGFVGANGGIMSKYSAGVYGTAPAPWTAGHAAEMILAGRRLTADEALGYGLVNRVTGPGQALDGARALAAEILDGSPTSVRISLQVMEETRGIPDIIDAVTRPSTAADDLTGSEDATEGVTAFAQKRRPVWRNR
jgi:hypothetical protein